MELIKGRTPVPVLTTPIKEIKCVEWNMVPADEKSIYSIFVAKPTETDFYEEIQAEADNCGFALMRRSIAAGQATPDMFKDDGARLDTTYFPEERVDAMNAANDPDAQKLMQTFGVTGAEKNLEAIIESKLKKMIQEQTQPAVESASTQEESK